ncbi:methylated-DNA--[protein]-cysteine S-methyltransferase [Brooklawnia cerclae]|uniref:Methylated-DNA-[protein]-cysteine S-methyltransferase n=1 Tax=Brooklawnia cerclae TaxID=349934 RepID=A0ABX0SHQ1_9ACTN|nr:methylated-DNA--[protein]-cysteine S-methyltransferase [Brooklawnia cerclae]NIH57933.1 methylated-DNA-[protein]-cysteine S-methyltransferase [Brooklawnia cerclae]
MTTVRIQTVDTPDGPFTVIEDAQGSVLASGWDDDAAALARRAHLDDLVDPDASHGASDTDATRAAAAVRAYYGGDLATAASVPVVLRGTPLQIQVWERLRDIAPGTVVGYGELAAALGRPNGARAVAGACARNPCGLFVPCHRVVAANGGLAGFAWGVSVKRSLLRRERAIQPEA